MKNISSFKRFRKPSQATVCALLLALFLPALVTTASHAAPPVSAKSPSIKRIAVFNVRDYGAKGDGVADDANAIQDAIDAAVKAGTGRTVFVPAGKYYLGKGRDDFAFFRLNADAVRLTFTGAGKTKTIFLTSGASLPFAARDCSDCALRNFAVDWKILNFTQGVITASDPARGVFEVTMDSGYAAPDADIFTARDGYAPHLRILSPGRNTFNWREERDLDGVEAAGNRWLLRVGKAAPDSEEAKRRAEQIGRRFFIWGRLHNPWTPLVDIGGVRNFTVENVDDYAGGGFAGGGGSRGTLTFRHYYSGPPAGSRRLGFYGGHQGHSRAAVALTDCRWVMSNDDDINALTELDYIHAHPAPDTLILAKNSDYEVDDKVSLWNYSNANGVKASVTASIKEITALTGDEMRVVLDRAVTVKKTGRGEDEKSGDDRMLGGRDRIVNLSSSGPWTMKNCVFNAAFAHPILLKSYGGITMENCRIYGSDMSGLESGMISFWNEGPQTRNVTLRGNTFCDNDGVSALIAIGAYRGNSTASHDQENIVIENNLFLFGGRLPVWNGVTPRGVAVMVSNTHTAMIRGNLFCGCPNSSISVYASDDVTISNNVFLEANGREGETNNRPERENIDPHAIVSINNSQNVALKNNVTYLNGPFVKTPVSVGVTNVSDVHGQTDGIRRGNALTFNLRGARPAISLQVPAAGNYRLALFYARTLPNDAPPFTLPAVTGKMVVNGKDAAVVRFENNGPASPATPNLAVIVPVTL